jgi:two-component system NtrC family sensor kinase
MSTPRAALSIAGAYAAFATAWILLSGWLVDVNIADPALRSAFEYGKGLFFVLVTACLLLLLVQRALRREQALAAEREAALQRLAEQDRVALVGLLASGLAHEFNNLHAVIIGNLERAKEHAQGNDGLRKRLDGAETALSRASGLTRSLLRFARPGTDERQPVRLDQLATETIELVQRALEADGVVLEQDLQPVPEVSGDPYQLGQVMMNLLLNACHAMRAVPMKRLHVATRSEAGTVQVVVTDSGTGMSEEVRREIFRPFFTTKRAAGGPSGSGLGLSVSLAMVEAHGGRIQVDSTLGQGTTFRVILPLR